MTILTAYADETACAIYEAATASDMAPFNDPVNHLPSVHFHSSLDYYGLAQPVVTTVVTHADVPADAGVVISTGAYVLTIPWHQTTADYLLATHSLGYPPLFKVVDEYGMAVPDGFPIQKNFTAGQDGGYREICFYATDTEIRLFEIAKPSNKDLPPLTKTYHVYVFQPPTANPALPMLELSGSPVFGQGKFQVSQQRLRRAVGETPDLYIPDGRRTDTAGGVARYFQGDGSIVDLASAASTYTGSFTPNAAIPAKVA